MGEEFVVVIVEKVVEKLIDPVIRQFSYVFFYKSNIKSLTDCLEVLQKQKSDVMLSVDAHNRNLDIIGQGVKSWLSNVEENDKTAQQVLDCINIIKNGCLNGWCPSLKQRYLVSRKAVKQTIVMKKLQEDGEKYIQIAYPALPEGVAATSSSGFVPELFESRISQTKEVIEALKNESLSKVGICGIGGVGKTRMAKEIRDRAIAEGLFDEVAMAVVTENPDLEKIQDQLGSMLGLKLNEKDITDVRGKSLHTRLTNGKRILVILDDVWKRLDLGEVGIPVGGQAESKGCKVLITSRNEHVCTATGTEKYFVVNTLSHTEAWDLFKEKSGVIEETDDLYVTARNICEECGCLPLAIITVSAALKGREKYEWLDALRQLETSDVTAIEGVEDHLYSRLRVSYKLLENNLFRQLFLLCCIFPEDCDISVEQLVRYVRGLQLLTNIPDLETVRHRVKSLVNQLKRRHLLLASDEVEHVKVHDVLRDFGLNEASRGDHVYLSRHLGEVQQLLQSVIIESHTAISISTRKELEFPPGLVCPSLQFLELSSEGSIELSNSYFGKMNKLKVVSFRGQVISFNSEDMLIESPPKTHQVFRNVQTLCLEKCRFSTGIGFLGSMQKLEILSFFRSEIDVLPREIGQLNNLKLLDLRGCTVGLISSGVLSSLQKLEDLYMGFYFFEKGVEERNNGKCASIHELCSLSALKVLQVYIYEPEVYSKLQGFFFDKLTSFDISFNAEREYAEREYTEIEYAKMESLLSRTEVLHLSNVNFWDNKIRESVMNFYKNLNELVVNSTSNLVKIFHGSLVVGCQVRPPCFANLKFFHLTKCHNVKSLFSASAARSLLQLQELEISECMMLEEVVIKDEAQNDEDAKAIKFPKLKKISLDLLPCFRSFYSAPRIICSEVSAGGCIINKDVLLPCIEMLYLCGKVDVEIRGNEYVNMPMFANLDTLIDLEGVEVSDENEKFIGQLESIEIIYLIGLLQIWKNVPKQGLNERSFCKLRLLHITGCISLRYLLCPTIAKMLVNLHEMELYGCSSLEQVITIEEDDDRKMKKNNPTIVFPLLWRLRLGYLSDLTAFYMGSHVLEFPSLVSLYVNMCYNMTKFSLESSITPKLESVKYGFGRYRRVQAHDLNFAIGQLHRRQV